MLAQHKDLRLDEINPAFTQYWHETDRDDLYIQSAVQKPEANLNSRKQFYASHCWLSSC